VNEQETIVMSTSTDSDAYRTVTPYLVVPNVAGLIEFLKVAFGAIERVRMPRPDGSVMHAEVLIGDSIVMMGEPSARFGPMPGAIYLTVADCDAVYKRAVECGATSVMEPVDQPHAGQRYGGVKDLCGNLWWPATPLAKK
jgi:uncharacterized glyoxalase superfamily protein PhnB